MNVLDSKNEGTNVGVWARFPFLFLIRVHLFSPSPARYRYPEPSRIDPYPYHTVSTYLSLLCVTISAFLSFSLSVLYSFFIGLCRRRYYLPLPPTSLARILPRIDTVLYIPSVPFLIRLDRRFRLRYGSFARFRFQNFVCTYLWTSTSLAGWMGKLKIVLDELLGTLRR